MDDKIAEGDVNHTTQRTILEQIYDWSKKQPMWQRIALKKIVQKSIITEQDIEELKDILKAEKSQELDEVALTPLNKSDLPANPKESEAVSLKNISNISHVNNLAAEQVLKFDEKGVTVIYGDNGSGKSGYTRILKSACRARHRDRILTNIFVPEFKDETPSADITYCTSICSESTIEWKDNDKPDSILSAVSVFDRECANIHIKEKNEIAFRPYGLDIPDKLADICKCIEKKINDEIVELEKHKNKIFSNPPWKFTTVPGRFASKINKDTKLEDLESIAKFSEDEKERLDFLTETLSKDIQRSIKEEKIKENRLIRFQKDIFSLIEKLSQEKLNAILTQKKKSESSRKAAEFAANEMLDEDLLVDVGSEVWKRMWLAAKEYSIKSAYPKIPFPNIEVDSKCVLCQQPLELNAKERMKAFANHVSSVLEIKADNEKKDYDELYSFSVFDYVKFSDYKEIMEDMCLIDPLSLKTIKRYLSSIRLRQIKFLHAINNDSSASLLPDYAPTPFESIDKQIKKHKDVVKELEKSASDEGIIILKSEKDELEDKKILINYKQEILDEIKRAKNISFLENCKKETNTRNITNLGNSIADNVITPKIRDEFQKEIVYFVGNRVRVEMNRAGGRFGSPYYDVKFFSDPGARLVEVLSEGEQTCVAIAVFLAELATANHKSALVFDDPVSSLDHKWRQKVAKRLAQEGKERQVIVFTHDLIFLNDIEDEAKKCNISFLSRHLTRFPDTVGIVNDNLPWDGMNLNARIDALEKDARKLKRTRSELTDEQYKMKVRDLYSHLRASWERALEEVGLSRAIMRHRDEIRAKDVIKISALDINKCNDWYSAYSNCCDYVSAHDASRGRNQEAPDPDSIIQEVNKLSMWVKELRDSQRDVY